MNKTVKIIVEAVLFIIIVFLVIANVRSIREPLDFNKQKDYRESVAIQRLKDIRTPSGRLQDGQRQVHLHRRFAQDVL